MKRLMLGTIALCLVVAGFSCGDDGAQPRPTPRPSPTRTSVIPPEPTETPTPLPVPDLDPPLPKLIGFTQVGDMGTPIDWPKGVQFQNNEETAKQLVENGFQAVHLWPQESVRSQDIRKVICNPGIKALTIRPGARVGADSDTTTGEDAATWENADFGQIAYDLLKRYGDLECRGGEDLVIILNNWEGDWQAKGMNRRLEAPTERRIHRVRAEYETAQWGVQWARESFPDAKLRVYFGLTVNHVNDEKYVWTLVRDLIPTLSPQPDLIGLSFYGDQNDMTITEMVETITRHTGYPVSRMYVAESGVNERWVGRQLRDIEPRLEEMEAIGIRLIYVWTWKQFWPGSLNEEGERTNGWFGNWVVDENAPGGVHNNVLNCWTSGLEFIQEFRQTFDEYPLPPVEKPDCSAEPTPTPVPPTPTPVPPTATPTPDGDACSHCPAPNSIGCVVNETVCYQCWADCGQPIVTPTPTRVPTNTPTITPTPDPDNPCPQCPDPAGFSCQMWPEMCYDCWATCGHPLATPTPTRTPSPTATPTPNDHPVATIYYEGLPTSCDFRLVHEETGATKELSVADCSEVELTFNKTGIWFIEIIAQYRHGWEVGVTEEPPVSEKDAADPMFVSRLQGDVDGDGKYEHVYIRKINILPRPEGQTT